MLHSLVAFVPLCLCRAALAQWSTAFKWATRECLNGVAGGVCFFVEGVEVRQQECALIQGLLFSIKWAQLELCALAFKPHCGV